jgi:hypothetical protein
VDRRRLRDTRLNPGAERRARQLLRESAGEEPHAMYDELGFIAVEGEGDAGYGYLLYPHRPIVAFDALSGEPLSEYCVRFPDGSDPEGGRWLPDADDLLAKWMALRGDERGLISTANLHPLGRQLDPAMVRRDLKILAAWKRSKEVGVAG